MKTPRWRQWVLAGLLVVAGCANNPHDTARENSHILTGFAPCPTSTNISSPLPDKPLPKVTLPCMDGSGQNFSFQTPTGIPLVINVWGSWCPPCGKELPAFQRLSAAAGGNKGNKLRVLGIVTEDNAERAKNAAKELGVDFANVYDRRGQFKRAMGRTALPLTVLVNAQGHIQHIYNSTPLDDDNLRQLVHEHLQVDVG